MSRAVSDSPPRRWPLPLLIVLGIGLVLRLVVAINHPIEYNGWWHVFIARNLTREYFGLAHPPLFLVLLRAVDALWPSRIAYQAISIVAGLACVVLVYRILEKLRASATIAFLGALTMATAQPAVFLSREVQSYMLAVCFILASFPFYLELARPEGAGWKPRSAFAAFASLALGTEYFAGLYLVAAVLAPLLVAVLRPGYGRALVRALPKRWLADLATLLPPLATGAALYELVAKPWIRPLNHLPEFYFVPGRESAAAFVTRNLWNLFNLFSPFATWSPRRAAAAVVLCVLLFLFAAVARARADDAPERALPAAILLLLLGLGVALGLRGLYPFGGAMRQQFLYFVFGLLGGFLAFDRLLAALPSDALRRGLSGLCLAAVLASVVLRLPDLRSPGRDPFTAQARRFDRDFPSPGTVQADQFNLIGYFIARHDWDWRFEGAAAATPSVQRYALTRAGRSETLLAHRGRWNFDVLGPEAFADLRAAEEAAGAPCFTAFVVHQNLYKPPERKLPHLEAETAEPRIRALAADAGLDVRKLVVDGDDVYLELCRPR